MEQFNLLEKLIVNYFLEYKSLIVGALCAWILSEIIMCEALLNWSLVRLLYLVVLLMTPKKNCTSQTTLIHVLLELVNLDLLYLTQGENDFLSMVACITVLNFQTIIVSETYQAIMLLTKFYLQWLPTSKIPSQLGFLVLFVVVINQLRRSQESKKYSFIQNLTKEKSELVDFIENLPSGVVVLDLNLQIKKVNKKALEYFCCSKEGLFETLRTLNYSNEKRIFYKEHPEEGVLCDIKNSSNLELNQEIELGIVSLQRYTLQLSLKKIKFKESEAFLLSIINSNEMVELEKSYAKKKFKTSLVRTMSHEMRTPVFAVKSITEQLLLSSNLDEKELESLSVANVSAKLLECFINNFLDYNHIELDNLELNLSVFDLKELLQETLKLVELQASRKAIRVFLRVDPMLPQVCLSDYKRLQQILTILLCNSLKHTCRGYIEVTAIFTATQKLKVCVKDTGIGIPPDRLPDILNPSTEHTSLQTCNMLVKALGGSGITIKSTLGKGSEFSFDAPITEASIDQVLESSSLDMVVPSEMSNFIEIRNLEIPDLHLYTYPSILLVDDNDFNRLVISTVLRMKGFQYLEATNGREAVDLVESQSAKNEDFKIVLMDCDMPVMNGWDATEAIQKLYSQKKIKHLPKVIGCSAFSSKEEIKKSYDSGMVLHLVKPISSQVLTSTIQYFLSNEY